MAAVRFERPKKQLMGASYPGTRRLYELVLGLHKPSRAALCLSRPPIQFNAIPLRWA